jgi:formylglycine-generating enzyme required for sulfatase activity
MDAAVLENSSAALVVEAGADAAGSDAGPVLPDEDAGTKGAACPGEMAEVRRLCIDRFEAYLVSHSTEGAEVILPHYQRPDTHVRYEARSASDVFPQAYISRIEATGACKNAGKRLCTRAEWMRGCRGPKGYLYPYGHRERAGQCNHGKLHLLPQFFGNNPRAWRYDEHFNSPRLDQEPDYLAKTGAYPGCTGDAGIFDMVGNLHEWVSDTVGDDIEEILASDETTRREQPHEVGNGIFMGGFFSTTTELGAGCKFTTIAHEPRYHDYSTGFRCCKTLATRPKNK